MLISWDVKGIDAFPYARPVWDGLVEEAGYPPFLRHDVLSGALRYFGTGNELLAFGRSDGRCVAAAILSRGWFGSWATFQTSQIPLGAWLSLRHGDWSTLVAGLRHALPGPSWLVAVTQQDPVFQERACSDGSIAFVDYVPIAWVEIDGEFDGFWEGLGKNLRQNLRKHRRKLEQQGNLSFEVLTDVDSVMGGLNDYAALESRGWKVTGGTAIGIDNAQGCFYSEVLRARAAENGAMVLRLCLDGRPLAVDLCLRDKSTVVILKTTYDESLKGYSLAQLLHEDAFRWFFGSGNVRRVEFYGRVMEWHQRWTDRQRILYHVNCYRWRVARAAHERLRSARSRSQLT